MSQVEDLLRDLVVANRILANEDVVDAYGHISVRHPDNPKRFFMARSLAPELVERHDLIEFDQAGESVNDKRQPYLERFIHAAIFEARPDVTAVVHAHAEDTLPFGLIKEPLQPVIIPAASSAARCRCGTSAPSSATPICSSPTWRRVAISPNVSAPETSR